MSRIEAKNISFRYKGNKNILQAINFELHEPCLVGLLGPNGIGKSTLLKCLNGICKVEEGKIYFDQRDITCYSLKELAQSIAYVPQNTYVRFSVSVMDFVLMGRIPYSSYCYCSKDYEAARRAIEETNLSAYQEKDVRKLSGGERQRVFVARALAGMPKVILMDEPTSSLDIKNSLNMLNLIKRLICERKIIVVMTIHDLSLAGLFCDRIIMLKNGRIWKDDSAVAALTEENIKAIYGVNTRVNIKQGKVYVQLENKICDTIEDI